MNEIVSEQSPKKKPQYNLKPITKETPLDSFRCGKRPLDWQIRKYGYFNHVKGAARMFACVEDNCVSGLYSLTNGDVSYEQVVSAIKDGQPENGNIPIVLVGQLAVHKNKQGKGLGAYLLRDALKRCYDISQNSGLMAVKVVAVDEDSKGFYEHFGFEAHPEDGLILWLSRDALHAAFENNELSSQNDN